MLPFSDALYLQFSIDKPGYAIKGDLQLDDPNDMEISVGPGECLQAGIEIQHAVIVQIRAKSVDRIAIHSFQ